MFYDMDKHEVVRQMPFGVFGQMSFERLQDVMRRGGEILAHEEISHFEVTHAGMIRFLVRDKRG
jgi:hypothetical protein